MAVTNYPISRLGRAPQFPFVLDTNGRFVLIQDEALIKQALIDRLASEYGRRFLLGEYGSKIKTLLFEKNAEVLQSLIQTFILEALRPEERVRIRSIAVESKGEIAYCDIRYTIVQSNSIDSLIYEVRVAA